MNGASSRDMINLSTKASGGYYNNKSKRILGSFYTKYYDKILTKLNLQSRDTIINTYYFIKYNVYKLYNYFAILNIAGVG
jgi:hypothetical protein